MFFAVATFATSNVPRLFLLVFSSTPTTEEEKTDAFRFGIIQRFLESLLAHERINFQVRKRKKN